MTKHKSAFLIVLAVCLFPFQNLAAKISILSPWSLQERLATPVGKFHQTAGFQAGINGVTPAGADIDSEFLAFPYHMTYGLREKVELGVGWGLLWVDRPSAKSQFGIADLVIAGRYRLFDADRSLRNPGLDMEAGFSFPTASFDKGLGTGGLGILFGWGLVLPLDPARAHFGMGFRLNTENSDNVKVGSVFSYNGGFSMPVKGMREDVRLSGEIKGFNHARNKVSGNPAGPIPDELYLCPGAIWQANDGIRVVGQMLLGLTGDSSDVGFNVELQF